MHSFTRSQRNVVLFWSAFLTGALFAGLLTAVGQ